MILRCLKCLLLKPLWAFPNRRSSTFGVGKQCLDCVREAARERARRAKEKNEGEWLERQRRNKRRQIQKMTADEKRDMRKGWACEVDRKHRSPAEMARDALPSLRKQLSKAISYVSIRVYRQWEKSQPTEYSRTMVQYFKEAWCISTPIYREYYRLKYQNVSEFATQERVRRQITKALKRDGIADNMRTAINRKGRSNAVEVTLGYSIQSLTEHLQRLFTSGMNWDEFSRGNIHIDHVKPQRLFDCTNPEEFRACWSLSNLQPLWASDNLAKGGKYVE